MQHGRRLVSLFGSLLVSLSAGSTYVFSSYAPQMQERLDLSSTQLNVLGLAGNLGLYISGPLWGLWVDKHGPHAAVMTGALLVLAGYGFLARAYAGEWKDTSVGVLAVFPFLTGLGNSAALSGAMNAQAKSWDGSHRGTAMALVLAGFGLSAFMYSTVSHVFFQGNVGGYLFALALGSFMSFIVGVLLVKIIPPSVGLRTVDHERSLFGSRGRDGYRSVATAGDEADGEPHAPMRRARSSSETMSRAYAWSRDSAAPEEVIDPDDLLDDRTATDTDISGFALLRQPDFLLLFSLMSFVSGAGLLLINNVGTIAGTLFDYNQRLAHGNAARSAAQAISVLGKAAKHRLQQNQALQVSLISVGNASGRILIGTCMADG